VCNSEVSVMYVDVSDCLCNVLSRCYFAGGHVCICVFVRILVCACEMYCIVMCTMYSVRAYQLNSQNKTKIQHKVK